MTDLETWLMIILAIAGALIDAGLKWAESGDGFDAKKVLSTLIRAGIAGAGIGIGQIIANPIKVDILSYFLSFLAGMGISTGIQKGVSSVQQRVRKNPRKQ